MKEKSPADLLNMPVLSIRHVESDSGFQRKFMSMRMAAPFFSTW